MSQKSDDRETLPLCSAHHKEQHRIGLRTFVRTYRLDIPELLALLTAKPRLSIWEGRYIAQWRDQTICLTLVEYGFTSAMICLRSHVQEILSEELRTRATKSVASAREPR